MVLTFERLNTSTKFSVLDTLRAIRQVKCTLPIKYPDDLSYASDDLVKSILHFEEIARRYGLEIKKK